MSATDTKRKSSSLDKTLILFCMSVVT